MEELAKQYPKAAEHLQQVPPHITEELGGKAVQLTHDAMHPKKEVPGEYYGTRLAADLDQVITDPRYDRSNLEVEAVEAAETGKHKLANILEQSAQNLQTAHQTLEESGFTFGASEIETDKERDEREKAERDTVYDAALEASLIAATQAKSEGNPEASVTALESLILLRHLKIGEQDYDALQNRTIFRRAVRAGLAEELLTAAQTSNKLYTGEDNLTVARSLYGLSPLLAYATGASIGNNFQVEDGSSSIELPFGEELMRDMLAALSSKGAWLTLDKARGASRSSTQMNAVLERIKPDLSEGVDSIEYYYDLLENNPSDELLDALKSTDPRQVLDTARQLEVQAYQVTALFGEEVEYGELIPLDTTLINRMTELKTAHPTHFEALIAAGSSLFRVTYDPTAIKECIDGLVSAGIDDTELTQALAKQENPRELTSAYLVLTRACKEQGIDYGQLKGMAELIGETPDSLLNLVAIIQKGDNHEHDMAEYISDLACEAGLIRAYLKGYRQLEYPLTHGWHEGFKFKLPAFERIQHRIEDTGIPSDVAESMFESWTTYDAFLKFHYDSENGFRLPSESLPEGRLKHIARLQANVLMTQLKSLETFVDSHGIYTTSSLINTFGIYNFSRRDHQVLVDQEAAWRTGTPIDSVVVDARADWNSFTNKSVVFDDELRGTAFYFEANSGRDAARIAVLVGKHERDNGREPNIQRFILHGHGSADSLVLGVNDEAITTAGYLEAAQKARKINASEVNDYKKHLGPEFEIVLQSCSNGAEVDNGKNIADTIDDAHAAKVIASNTMVHGLTIMKDGSVRFESHDENHQQVVYGG